MKLPPPVVHFNFMYVFRLPERNRLKTAVKLVFENEGKKLCRLDYIFCSDHYLLTLNQNYLEHDTLTDVITFDLSEDSSCTTGEIYISIDRIRENADLFHTSFLSELRRVVFHGALHLCGYRDKTKAEKLAMTQKEDFYLSQY